MDITTLLLSVLGLYFAAIVVVSAEVFERPRNWLLDVLDLRWPWMFKLLSCRFCTGTWLSIAAFATTDGLSNPSAYLALLAVNGAHYLLLAAEAQLVAESAPVAVPDVDVARINQHLSAISQEQVSTIGGFLDDAILTNADVTLQQLYDALADPK